MTLRVDEQGRPLALVAYSPDQARAPEGAANGGQWVSDESDQSASQSDSDAKRMYADLLNLPPEQRAAYLAKLSPDQLTRLGKFASTGKEAKGPIADIKSAVGNAMAGRGLNPATAGLKAKPGKKGAAKKGGKSGGSKGGGGKSSGGGKKSSGGGSKKSGGGSSKKSGGSSSKSGSKSSGSKSSGSTKTPAKTTTPAKPTPPPAPPAVKPIGPGRPGARPTPGPPSTQPVRPAGRVGKRRRRTSPR